MTRYQRQLEDLFLTTIKDVATEYSDYMSVLNHVKNKTPVMTLQKEPVDSPVHSYLSIWDRLGILDNEEGSLITIDKNYLVVSKKYQRKLLEIAHMSHHGQMRTYKSL